MKPDDLVTVDPATLETKVVEKKEVRISPVSSQKEFVFTVEKDEIRKDDFGNEYVYKKKVIYSHRVIDSQIKAKQDAIVKMQGEIKALQDTKDLLV